MKPPKLQKLATAAALQNELSRRDERIAELRQELFEASKLVDDLQDQVEDSNALIDDWSEFFEMSRDDSSMWSWSWGGETAEHWKKYEQLVKDYNALADRWNRKLPAFNAGLRPVGRPLAASKTQVANVKARRQAGESLRAIASTTGLGFATVRTIIAKDTGTDPASRRRRQMIKLERDRVRAAEYRLRKRGREGLPKRITSVRQRGDELVLRAKGLGKGLV